MAPLPNGNVTFLFSDVEGSTRLLERDPGALGSALARHHELLAGAVAAHAGAVFETVGDAVYAAFGSPGDALAAAAAIQRAMAAADWSPFEAFRVRLAVEMGAVERRGDHYFGAPLFRCARLQALARGGQILCSADVAGAVGAAAPPATRLRPRGPHRLKDLAEPIEVLELLVDGLPADERPLRGASATPTNLPAELTSFVGRRAELAEISDALREHRLVTLLGPGGTGKTRLAVEAGRALLGDFPDGVFLAELAAITDPEAVPDAIAAATGVAVRPGEPAGDALARALADRHVLLVIDNWEHVLPAAPVVPQIASAAPGVHVLATSRVPLRVRGEQRLPVPQLDPAGDASSLFRLRAEAVGARITAEDEPVVAQICSLLDGLPLAIELVAARAGTIPLRSILAGVERGVLAASGGTDLPDRQRTVEQSVAWSVDLLPDDLRTLFARLGAFAGSFTPADVASVARTRGAPSLVTDDDLAPLDLDALDGLAALAEASLLVPREDPLDEPRFGMLETIRSSAAVALARSSEAEVVGRRHAQWIRSVAVDADRLLADVHAGAWMARFDALREDVAAAMEQALGGSDGELACGIVGDLWPYWDIRGVRPNEHARALRSIELPGAAPATLAKAINTVGILEGSTTRVEGRPWFARAVELYRTVDAPLELAEALNNLAISLEPRDPRFIPLLEEAVALKRAHGAQGYELVNSTSNLATLRAYLGDLEGARRDADVGLGMARRFGGRLPWVALGASAYVAAIAGDRERLTREATEGLASAHAVAGHGPQAADLAELRALAFAQAGDVRAAGRLFGYGAALRGEFASEPDVFQLQIRDRILGHVAAALESDAWHAAVAEGRNLTDEEALALARSM